MSKIWWKAAGIRALKTFAQTAIALIGTSAILQDVGWLTVLSGSVLATFLSLLTSVAALPEVGLPEVRLEEQSVVRDYANSTE